MNKRGEKKSKGIKCNCCPHLKIEGRKLHICGSCFDCSKKNDLRFRSPLQEPRENKLAKAMLKANKVFYTKQQTIKVLPPQPEKTDYQKRIEAIVNRNRYLFDQDALIEELLSLLQEVRSEALEAREKRIEEIIGEDEACQVAVASPAYKKGWHWKSKGDCYIRNKFRREIRSKLKEV